MGKKELTTFSLPSLSNMITISDTFIYIIIQTNLQEEDYNDYLAPL